MNSQTNILKIADLTPNTSSASKLVFEVAQVIKLSQDQQQVQCRVVDQSGIITAFFDQYGKFITQGSVLQLTDFKCRVIDHHLTLLLTKHSVISKKPLKMGFKDMENDLSSKFYAKKNKQENQQQTNQSHRYSKQTGEIQNQQKKIEIEQKRNGKKTQIQHRQEHKQVKSEATETKRKVQNGKEKSKYKQKQEQTSKIEPRRQQKLQIEQDQLSRKAIVEKQKSRKGIVEKQGSKKGKVEEQIRVQYKQKQQRYVPNQQQKQRYVPNKQKKQRYIPKHPQNQSSSFILLRDLPRFQEKQVNLRVEVNVKSRVDKSNYFICRVGDASGSVYVQFAKDNLLQANTSYELMNFVVYGDKDYVFVGAQEKYSRINKCPQEHSVKANWDPVYF